MEPGIFEDALRHYGGVPGQNLEPSPELKESTSSSGFTRFNLKYQEQLSTTMKIQEYLAKSIKQQDLPKVKPAGPAAQSKKNENLSSASLHGLLENFALVSKLAKSNPKVKENVMKTILTSMDSLELNSLESEPDLPLDKLEEVLQDLLLLAPGQSENKSRILATLLNLALTRASSTRLFKIIETLSKLRSDFGNTKIPLPPPVKLITYASKSDVLAAPKPFSGVDEFDLPKQLCSHQTMVATSPSGSYLFLYHPTEGLYKIGTGKHGTVKNKIYKKNEKILFRRFTNFFYSCGSLFFRDGNALYFADPEDLEPFKLPESELKLIKHSRLIALPDSILKLFSKVNGGVTRIFSSKFKFSRRKNNGTMKFLSDTTKIHGKVRDELGGLYGCGGNMCGELGVGNRSNVRQPRRLDLREKDVRVRSIATGNQFNIIVLENGNVYCAGNNGYGQLGFGHRNQVNTWTLNKKLTDLDLQVVCGGTYNDSCFGVTKDHKVYVWGSNYQKQLGLQGVDNYKEIPTEVKELADKKVIGGCTDYRMSIFLTESGEVYVAGRGSYGELGIGRNNQLAEKPQLIKHFVEKDIKIVQVCGSYTHAMFLTDKGDVWCTGQNSYGQLGDGTRTHRYEPVKTLFKDKIVKIAAGYYHSVALDENGVSYTWGNGGNGCLGHNNTTQQPKPKVVEFFGKNNEKVINIEGGGFHTGWLCDSGKFYSCGSNSYGEIFIGQNGQKRVPTLVQTFKEDQFVTHLAFSLYSSIVVVSAYDTAFDSEILSSKNAQKTVLFSSGNSLGVAAAKGVRNDPEQKSNNPSVRLFEMKGSNYVLNSSDTLEYFPHARKKFAHFTYNVEQQSFFIVDPEAKKVRQLINSTYKSSLVSEGAKALGDLRKFPHLAEAMQVDSRFSISKTTSMATIPATVLSLASSLELISRLFDTDKRLDEATKQWAKFMIAEDTESFQALISMIQTAWSDHTSKDFPEFSALVMLCGLRILRANLKIIQKSKIEVQKRLNDTLYEPVIFESKSSNPTVRISKKTACSLNVGAGGYVLIDGKHPAKVESVFTAKGDNDHSIYITGGGESVFAELSEAKACSISPLEEDEKALPASVFDLKLLVNPDGKFESGEIDKKFLFPFSKAVSSGHPFKTGQNITLSSGQEKIICQITSIKSGLKEIEYGYSTKSSVFTMDIMSVENALHGFNRTPSSTRRTISMEKNPSKHISNSLLLEIAEFLKNLILDDHESKESSEFEKAVYTMVSEEASHTFAVAFKQFYPTWGQRCGLISNLMKMRSKNAQVLLNSLINISSEYEGISYMFFPKLNGEHKASAVPLEYLAKEFKSSKEDLNLSLADRKRKRFDLFCLNGGYDALIELLIAKENPSYTKMVQYISDGLIKRLLLSKAPRFTPLSFFSSFVFDSVSDQVASFLTQIQEIEKTKNEKDQIRICEQVVDAYSKNDLLVSRFPLLVAHLSILISKGWREDSYEIGDIAQKLLAHLLEIYAIISRHLSKSKENQSAPDFVSYVSESIHPYDSTGVDCCNESNEYVFPEGVEFIVCEFDPRCCTTQEDDYVEIWSNGRRVVEKRFHGVTNQDWLPSSFVIPSNKCTIKWLTHTDYNEPQREGEKWGYKLYLRGYLKNSTQSSSSFTSLIALINPFASQLSYLASVCASGLVIPVKLDAFGFSNMAFKRSMQEAFYSISISEMLQIEGILSVKLSLLHL